MSSAILRECGTGKILRDCDHGKLLHRCECKCWNGGRVIDLDQPGILHPDCGEQPSKYVITAKGITDIPDGVYTAYQTSYIEWVGWYGDIKLEVVVHWSAEAWTEVRFLKNYVLKYSSEYFRQQDCCPTKVVDACKATDACPYGELKHRYTLRVVNYVPEVIAPYEPARYDEYFGTLTRGAAANPCYWNAPLHGIVGITNLMYVAPHWNNALTGGRWRLASTTDSFTGAANNYWEKTVDPTAPCDPVGMYTYQPDISSNPGPWLSGGWNITEIELLDYTGD